MTVRVTLRTALIVVGLAIGAFAPAPPIEHPDLSKVDEIGFADLMPGSGHGPVA